MSHSQNFQSARKYLFYTFIYTFIQVFSISFLAGIRASFPQPIEISKSIGFKGGLSNDENVITHFLQYVNISHSIRVSSD